MLNIVIVLFIGTVSSNELGGIICRMGKNIGFECVGNSPRQSAFYFDSDIGQCIEFEFRGCGGNFNRFSTMEECQAGCRSMTKCKKGFPLTDFAGNIKRCDGDRLPCPGGFECVGLGMESVCCKLADRVCSTSVDTGNSCGIAAKIRFYFDPVSNLCRPFNFLGCGGNENNFDSRGQCLQFCASTVLCQKGDPLPDRFSSSRVARCHHDAHCPRNYTCVGSNRQHKTCCPSREFICKLPYDSKLACHRPQLTKELWTFNVQSGTCENISPACSDQLNTFASREQCSDFCIGQCPDGLHTHRNPSNGLPQLCDVQQQYGCPLGFECLQMYN